MDAGKEPAGLLNGTGDNSHYTTTKVVSIWSFLYAQLLEKDCYEQQDFHYRVPGILV